MADSSYVVVTSNDTGQQVVKKKLIDNGDNTFSESVSLTSGGGVVKQHAKDVTPANIAEFYNFTIANGDFVNNQRSSNGQRFTEVSIDPLSAGDTQTIIEYAVPFNYPSYSEISASMSQRTKGDYVVIEITDKDTSFVDTPGELTISSISQSTTTLTVVLTTAFDGYLASWVDIYGLADNRFNYTNLAVATISTDKKTLTFTTSDEATLPNITATPTATGGKLKGQPKLLGAANVVGMRFTGTSATAAAYMARFGGGSIKEAGTLTGARLVTSASTAPTYTSGSTGQVELKATSRFKIDITPDKVTFTDVVTDSPSLETTRLVFTDVKPANELDYYVRFRAVSPKSISKPIAKIVSATKATATTTATIVTDVPHGLTTSSYVTIKGIANQTVFASLATPTVVASVINETTFTIVIGTATIATSYGGTVILCNGQVDQQGIIGQVPQSVARDANGIVTVVGNTTWSGLNIGEYVNLHGVRNVTNGGDLGFDGVYEVHNVSNATLLLEPVKDLAGKVVYNGSLTAVTPTGGVVNTTSCGGAVILRTTLRSHDFLLATYTQQITKIYGQGTSRADLSLPVNITSSAAIAVNTTEVAALAPSTGTLTTAATTNGTSLKTTAGSVYNLNYTNIGATPVYLKLYNKASAPIVGTDIPIATIPVAANSFISYEMGRLGLRFSLGIACAITGAIASNDTTAIGAGSLLTISYV